MSTPSKANLVAVDADGNLAGSGVSAASIQASTIAALQATLKKLRDDIDALKTNSLRKGTMYTMRAHNDFPGDYARSKKNIAENNFDVFVSDGFVLRAAHSRKKEGGYDDWGGTFSLN